MIHDIDEQSRVVFKRSESSFAADNRTIASNYPDFKQLSLKRFVEIDCFRISKASALKAQRVSEKLSGRSYQEERNNLLKEKVLSSDAAVLGDCRGCGSPHEASARPGMDPAAVHVQTHGAAAELDSEAHREAPARRVSPEEDLLESAAHQQVRGADTALQKLREVFELAAQRAMVR